MSFFQLQKEAIHFFQNVYVQYSLITVEGCLAETVLCFLTKVVKFWYLILKIIGNTHMKPYRFLS